MANVADAKKQLEERAADPGVETLVRRINAMGAEVARVLPKGLEADRMLRLAVTLVRRTPGLGQVTPDSFLGAFMTCNQLGLEPGGPLGLAWILPREVYKDKRPTGVFEAHFQLGYKGAIVLARRSGELSKVTCRTVYAAEQEQGRFSVDYEGVDEFVRHTPILIGERGDPALYYCIARMTSGEQTFTPLRPEDVEKRHRNIGNAANSPAWRTHYEAMAHKSCVVEARRWWPMSVDLELAIAQDGQVRTDPKPEALDEPVAKDWVDGEAQDWPPVAQPADGDDPPKAVTS